MAETTRRPPTFAYLASAAILVPTALIAAWYTNESIWYGVILVVVVFAIVDFSGQRLERWVRGPRDDKSDDHRPKA